LPLSKYRWEVENTKIDLNLDKFEDEKRSKDKNAEFDQQVRLLGTNDKQESGFRQGKNSR
jgi:hypothetical protein